MSDPLSLLQQNFAILDLGGEIRLINLAQVEDFKNGQYLDGISYYKRSEGNIFMERFLENQPISCKPREIIGNFWSHNKTKVFNKVAFSPESQDDQTLNYWVAPRIKPVQGDWGLIDDFLLNVICAGDANVYKYLLNFLAHMIQRPEVKPGVMVVLLGGQGIGKGTFFKLLRKIWFLTALQVSDVDAIIGRFNAVMERSYIVMLDEAIFVGDRRVLDQMKSLITEDVVHVEQKYQPARSIRSYHRFFAASNHEHFAHVEMDDRRFLFLRVSKDRQGDHSYFSQLNDSFESPEVISAFMYELTTRDITNFTVYAKPNTAEHLEQKLRSLSGFNRYWYEVLMVGNFYFGCEPFDQSLEWKGCIFVATEKLKQYIKHFDKYSERYGGMQSQVLAQQLLRLCPSAQADRKKVNGLQQRGFNLPSLVQARTEFESFIGGVIDWDDQKQGLPSRITIQVPDQNEDADEDEDALAAWVLEMQLEEARLH